MEEYNARDLFVLSHGCAKTFATQNVGRMSYTDVFTDDEITATKRVTVLPFLSIFPEYKDGLKSLNVRIPKDTLRQLRNGLMNNEEISLNKGRER